MVRRFFKDSAVYALANITARGLSLFFVPYYVRVLAEEEIGTLDLILAWSGLATVITGLEIAIGLARGYAEQKDDAARREVASTAFWFSLIVYGLFFVVAAAAARPIAAVLLGNASHATAVTVSAASVSVAGVYIIISQQLRYMMKSGLFALLSLLSAVTALVSTICYVSWLRMGVAGVLLGTLTGVVAAGFPAWYLTRGMFAFTFSRSRCIQLLKFSLPLVPSSIAVILTAQISRLALDHFLSRDAVGVYGIAARIGSMITLVMAGFQNALAPLVFARHAEKETPGDLAKIFRIFAVAALAGTAGFVLFSREVLHVMTSPDYAGALPAVMILAPSALLAQMYVFAPGAWIAKRTWWITGVNVCAAALSVGLNWTLIPIAGLQGAAWASLASALFSFALNMLVSQRLYPVPHHWSRMAVALAGTALCVVCGLSFGGVAPWTGVVVRFAALSAAVLWIWRILGLHLRLRGRVDSTPAS